MKQTLQKILDGNRLSQPEAHDVMQSILKSDEVSPELLSALLAAMRTRKETTDELLGFAKAILEHAHTLPSNAHTLAAIDVCGTGGDGANTFNISTATAFVAAGGGAKIAKHGNRSVSSQCGSSDVLNALGLPLVQPAHELVSQLSEIGLCFLFAPEFHPILKRVADVRRALGVRTVFNLLGPMLNPMRVKRHVMGVFDAQLHRPIAETLMELGSEEALILTSRDGLDEFSLSAPTVVTHLSKGHIRKIVCDAQADFGIAKAGIDKLAGGSPEGNAAILESILAGETGPRRDIVILNAAAALWVAGKSENMKHGIELAKQSIDSGRARDVLQQLRNRNSLNATKQAVSS